MNFNEKGYTFAGALTLIAILSILMALSLPLWSWLKQRDNEEELIFRGREYVEAIARYHQKYNSYPPDVETLVKLKFLRKLYKDPMTKSGEWKVLHPDSLVQTGAAGAINQPNQPGEEQENQDNLFGSRPETKQDESAGDAEKESDEDPEQKSTGPVVGVASRSKKKSIKIVNGQNYYNKWVFTYAVTTQQEPSTKPKPKSKSSKKSTQPPPESKQ
jgi:type II secretory pathway pseudopilin PulG